MGKKKAAPTPMNSLDVVIARFKRLKELRNKIVGMKALYVEHDNLMRELLPLFISEDKDSFLIAREIVIGTHKYRFTPAFYSAKDGLKSKAWKSTAFETGTID